MDFPRGNSADIDWYMRMSRDLALVDPKVEMLLELCEEESVTLEPTFPIIDT